MTKVEKFTQKPPSTVRSTLVLPAMACDCHGHIFPDPVIYPAVNETMPLAPVEMFLDVHAQLGFQRGVLVQGGVYKFDNRAMLDALDLHPDTLRGVALLPADTSEDELAAYVRRNVRALRFTQGGASRIDSFSTIAPSMQTLGLHAEMFIGLENFVERAPDLLFAGVPLVLDHLAGPFDPAAGIEAPAFVRVLTLLADSDNLWVKLTPQRNSLGQPIDMRTRAHLEPRFNHAFSWVRTLNTDSEIKPLYSGKGSKSDCSPTWFGDTSPEMDPSGESFTGRLIVTYNDAVLKDPCVRECVELHESVHVTHLTPIVKKIHDCDVAAGSDWDKKGKCNEMATRELSEIRNRSECEAYRKSFTCLTLKILDSQSPCSKPPHRDEVQKHRGYEGCEMKGHCKEAGTPEAGIPNA